MTNDSELFRTRPELEEKEGAWPIGGNRFGSPSGEWVPLYVGRMIHQFDHRAASVHMNEENLHNPALSDDISAEEKADPALSPTPQYWVPKSKLSFPASLDWTVAFRDIASATDKRTMIAAAVPAVGLGNKVPALFPEEADSDHVKTALLLGNLGATVLDFVVRQKAHSTNLNWFIVEQLPVVPPERYRTVSIGPKTAEEIVREVVLELTYTAHAMAPFARGMGHVDEGGRGLAALPLDRRPPPPPASQVGRALLPPLRHYGPRRHTLHLLNFPHRRTRRDSRLWGLPVPRPVPCVDERARRWPTRRGTRHVSHFRSSVYLYPIFVRFVDLWPPTSLVNAEFLADGPSVVPPCAIGPRTGTGGDCSRRHRGPT